jgi:hypothetical protein
LPTLWLWPKLRWLRSETSRREQLTAVESPGQEMPPAPESLRPGGRDSPLCSLPALCCAIEREIASPHGPDLSLWLGWSARPVRRGPTVLTCPISRPASRSVLGPLTVGWPFCSPSSSPNWRSFSCLASTGGGVRYRHRNVPRACAGGLWISCWQPLCLWRQTTVTESPGR